MNDDTTDVKQRLDEIEAKYEQEVRRLSREIAEANKRISQLEDERAEREALIDELGKRLEQQHARIIALEAREHARIEGREYNKLSRDEKIGIIRDELIQRAFSNGQMSPEPIAKFTNKDVRRLFDGRATARHAYDLMEAAAAEDGFEYHEVDGKKNPNYLRVHLEHVPRGFDRARAGSAEERT